MSGRVWCVFQRLADDPCPTLSSVCATRELAEEVVRLASSGAEITGEGEWSIRGWSLLRDAAELREIQQISGALDPMRRGAIPPSEARPE